MHSQRRRQAVGLWARIPFLVLLTCGCTPAVKGTHPQTTPLTLTHPTSVSSTAISLTVGTNRLPTQDGGVEEAFLPVAVTVRNTGDHTLCGGAHTAVLGDSAGVSVSATLPEEVVSRLFGPLASLQPMRRPAALTERFSDPAVFLMLVHGSHGMHSGIGSGSGGFSGRTPQAPYLRPSPRVFRPPFGFPSPFASPFSTYPFSPFYRPFPYSSPYGYYAPYSPFPPSLPPFNPTPFSPFDRPPPPLSPYGYAPYGYPPPPATPGLPEEHYPAVDSALIKEILSTAFASRPLALQEERSGFLFFPLPVPSQGATLLAWDWYDCATSELVTHLSIPISVEKKV